jgi:ATP-dependent helicase HrpA
LSAEPNNQNESDALNELEKQVAAAMTRDHFRLRQSIARLKSGTRNRRPAREKDATADSTSQPAPELETQIAALADSINQSVRQRESRAAKLPQPVVDPDLPIAAREQEICDAIRNHQVVVVSGATGSGKSTQLPLIAMKAGYGVGGMIGHTQPRRIAARSVANRIAGQLGKPLGAEVGFKIRFADQTGEGTYVKLMTDGILLAETQSDRFLDQYDLIIVDEAHERSLNIDFLLGYLKRILHKRPDFRLVITSATIDTERFAKHFSEDNESTKKAADSVPIIDVEGRTYPVEIRYHPPASDVEEIASDVFENHLIHTIQDLAATDNGDMLVFLPTENDIRSAHKKLRSTSLRGGDTEVLPLYARLTTAQQNEIFSPGKRRRIVLATNVAESSITVPRIRFVIDSGTARISHYSPRSKVQRLPIQAVSQASADQRAGRCGRIGPGICVRLYSEEDFDSRPKFTVPEIRRTNLASVILQTLALKLGNIGEFPFLDPPRTDSIRDGFKTLFELGAVDEHRRLTQLGRSLARLPVDPRIGRMLFESIDEGCLAEVLIIASGLEMQDPRVRPAEKKQAADTAHKKFVHEKSDFMTLLNIWDFFHEQKSNLSKSKLRLACEQNFLSFSLLRQWQDIHRQLRSMVIDGRMVSRNIPARKNDYGCIHRSLLAGLLSGIAMLGQRHEYTGAGGIQFHLWPGSGVFESKPKWGVAAEIVETTRRYARTVAKISPEWIEPLAAHLTKSRYSDPHWSKKRQSVVASEHVSLWGLPIVSGRAVNYGKIDPEVARRLMIEEGLVAGTLEPTFEFLDHNQWVIDQIQKEAAKTRRRDLVIDEHTIEQFYETRLPAHVVDRVSLTQALKKTPDLERSPSLDQTLRMTRGDLLPALDNPDQTEQFPDQVQIGSMEIPIEYRFEPGAVDDGATVRLPLAGVGQMDEVQSGWLVPGLMESRILALIRSLPKSVRRNLVPAPETAQQVVREIEFGNGDFFDVVARHLSRIGGQPVTVNQFDTEKIDSHLKINLQVVDDAGEIVAQGRSLTEIRSQLGPAHVSSIVDVADETWHQDGLTQWTWGDFPAEFTITRGGTKLAAFPTIVDAGEAVNLRLSDSRAASDQTTKTGLTRLLHLLHRKQVKSQVNWLPDLDRHSVTLARVIGSAELKSRLGDLIIRIGFVEREKIPRSESAFQELQSNASERTGIATQEVAKWLPKFSESLHEVCLRIDDLPSRFSASQEDMQFQFDRLFAEGFMAETPWQWLQQFPRYLDGMLYRVEKLTATDHAKEKQQVAWVDRFWQQYAEALEYQRSQAMIDPELTQFRWMIEEYRVSLFAQPLGTAIKVSDTRLEKQFKKLRR